MLCQVVTKPVRAEGAVQTPPSGAAWVLRATWAAVMHVLVDFFCHESLKTMSAMSMFVSSQEEAAEILGCNPRQFARWLKQGCPGEPRRYVLKDCIAWARKHPWADEEILEGVSGELKDEYLKERIEKLKRENALTDLKLKDKTEALVDADAVREQLARQASVVRSSLERLERKYGSDALDIVLEAFDQVEQEWAA